MTSKMRTGLVLVACTVVMAAADLTNEQKEEFLRSARIVDSKTLGMGITQSKKATLEDASLRHAAHVQTIDESKAQFTGTKGTEINFRDTYKYNIAAYELAKLLDVPVPPSVDRKFQGQGAAITWWVDNVAMTELDRYKKKLTPPNPEDWNRQMYTVRVFDQLIHNTDRNLGNLVITADWQIWMIDHTRAFRTMKSCPDPKMLQNIDSRLAARMRSLTSEVVTERLGSHLTKMEIAGLMARRNQILRVYDEQVAAKSASQTVVEIAQR